ncbi:hypothetical protein D9M73_199510 [compost metagenome]
MHVQGKMRRLDHVSGEHRRDRLAATVATESVLVLGALAFPHRVLGEQPGQFVQRRIHAQVVAQHHVAVHAGTHGVLAFQLGQTLFEGLQSVGHRGTCAQRWIISSRPVRASTLAYFHSLYGPSPTAVERNRLQAAWTVSMSGTSASR